MIEIVVDLGNSDLVLGIFYQSDAEPQSFRYPTREIHSPALEDFFRSHLYHFPMQTPIIISSVVPDANKRLEEALSMLGFQHILLLGPAHYSALPIEILKPAEIGTDLVANALAAFTLYRQDCIVVDFGTALSFTTIDSSGTIIGVAIAPGLKTALRALTSHAAQLFEVEVIQPPSALGKDTEQAIQAGVTYGYDGLVRGLIQAQEKELNKRLLVVVTGGLRKVISTLHDRVDHYHPFLTLYGIRTAWAYIRK
jgi:type III pantothenate kinase